ncbi:MAG: TM0996/MTH895 family glutaredoxin-like protein [Desulfobacteraceae bacterium]|nr:MAG: TM0996/MTH895 family glutaredoxin-like protein [Desulfobacteraceae bacterium]
MKKLEIQVLGMGCPKCRMLVENAKKAVSDLGLDYEIKMLMDMRFGMIMTTPALIIDGKIKITGEVASVEEIKQLILENMTVFR